MSQIPDRRKSSRRPVHFAVRHTDPLTHAAVLDEAMDLSESGIFLRTPTPPPIGATLELEFPINAPPGTRVLRTVGEVARVTAEGIAARFTQLDPDSALLLNLLLAS